MKYTAHGYQKKATERILQQKHVGLFLDMGLGKTVITLTAIKELIEDFAIWKVLVIAPKRVAEDTWRLHRLRARASKHSTVWEEEGIVWVWT